jgi:ABC-type uncharacterized transport system substrate-binding protein
MRVAKALEERCSAGDMTLLRRDARQLLGLKPDLILVAGRRAVAVFREQTRDVPVIFAGISDPVETEW